VNLAYSNADVSPRSAEHIAELAYRKVTRRTIPLLFACYVMAHLDRNNIGYAQLQMKVDLAFSDAIYGLGAGIFFLGYILFEVPSNLLLVKVGVRKTLLRIMVGWGIVSALTMFVRTPMEFYAARFLLGVFEAGFFPGIILYLSWWFPAVRRARIIALFMTAIAAAGIVGGPISGAILTYMDGVLDQHGWQWMFLLEGIPSVVLGFVAFRALPETPDRADWLAPAERRAILDSLAAEKDPATHCDEAHPLRGVIRNPTTYILAAIFFMSLCGVYTLNFWKPMLIQSFGVSSPLAIGCFAAIPYTAAAIAMVLTGRHSDQTRERRWHYAIATTIGAAGLALTTVFAGHTVLAMTVLTIGTAGIFAGLPVFWSVSTQQLSRRAATVGIAYINSISVFAGAVAPYAIGLIKTATGTMSAGLLIISGLLITGAVLMICSVPRR
jgi:MFS family permease